MFNNVNAKKRLTQVIVAFVIICMAFTGSFLLLNDSINTVQAEDRTVTTQGQWDAVIDEINKAGGGTWTITLGDNITVASKLSAIPAGANVTLNMNNKNISWNDTGSGNNNIMSTSYSAADTYWGTITNNGTLNIQGTGTINSFHVRTGYKNGSGRDSYIVKHAAIVNTGTLTVGANITVKSYTGMSHDSGSSYQDMFVYTHGIYNTNGTVNSSGIIKAGSLAQGVIAGSSGSNSYAVAYSYGIYGGNVNVTGGNIYSEAKSGFSEHVTIPKTENQTHNLAFGIFANNAKVLGNTSITTKATSWRDNDSNYNTWKNGSNMSWGVGVMYYGSNYPVIGPGVNIDASYQLIANESSFSFPEYDTALGSWTRSSSNGPGSYGRHAYAVAKCPVDVTTAAMYGGQTGETLPASAMGISVSTAPGAGEYYTEYAKKAGTSTRVTSSDNKSATGSNDNGTQTSNIKRGAPGTTGSQYLVVYRFYTDVNTIESVSFKYDSAKLKSEASITVGSSTNNKTGIVPDNNTKISYAGGAESKNTKYYDFVGARYELVETSSSDLNSKLTDIDDNGNAKTPSKWKGSKGILPAEGVDKVSTDKDNVIIIYLDYQRREPTGIKIVAANAGTAINEYTTTTEFTVPYTGAPLKPGTDFNLGILDAADNNKVITNVYDISGSGSGSGNNATGVSYRYTSNGSDWNNGLPKDVGSYQIEVNVNADKTFAESGTYNREGKQQIIKATITPANVSIEGPTSVTATYGGSYGEIFDFNNYKAKNKAGEVVSGTWSLSGVSLSTVPGVGSYTNVKIVWTPGSAESKNYGVTEYPVTLTVNKRALTVNAGNVSVTYGDAIAASSYKLSYDKDLTADSSKAATWLASTKFEIKHNGEWKEYYQGVPAGTYELRIKSFGGASDANNTFTLNEATATLTVDQRAIKYTAEAVSRDYIKGDATVDVTLKNPTNAYQADTFDPVINAKGTMNDANAGANKAVTVTGVKIENPNYYLVIENAASLTVNIAKATPSGVYVSAANPNLVYNKTQTLASVALAATENPEISGTWAWADPTAVPTVNVSKYTAKFTPDDSNYKTLEVAVDLIVDKAVVRVVVDADPNTADVTEALTVTYGDAVPALANYIRYIGLTGDDSIDAENFAYEGNTDVSTEYNPGSSVRDGGYTVSVSTNIVADNYEFVAENNKINVKAKAITVTAKDYKITYGDNAPEFDETHVTATGFISGESINTLNATIAVTTTYVKGSSTGKVGTYPINVAVTTSNKNYDISTVAGTLTVEKAVLTVTPASKTVTFGADVPTYATAGTDYTVAGFVNGDTYSVLGGKFDISTQYTSSSYVNTYPVSAVTVNMEAENYSFVSASGSINVIKADPSVTTAPAATVVNSHSLADAKFDNTAVVVNPNNGLAVPGTFKFVDSATKPVWGETKAYPAVFTPEDDHNYNTANVNVTVTVTVKTISGIPVVQGSAMVGSTLSVSLASVDPSTASVYTYQWYRVDGANTTPISGATGSTYVVVESDLDKAIYVVIDADESNGFTGTAASEKTTTVIDALEPTDSSMFVSTFPGTLNAGAYEVVYNANTFEVTVGIADEYKDHVFGDIVVKYNGSVARPENAGTYVVTIDVGVPASKTGTDYDDGYIYQSPVSGMEIGTLKILPATLTANVLVSDKTYDGTVTASANITLSGVYEDDTVNLDSSAKVAFLTRDAGENKAVVVSNITLIGEDAGNYVVDEDSLNATATILPKTLEVEVRGVKKTYDKSATVDVTFVVNSNTYAAVDNASTIYLTNGKAVATSADAGENIAIKSDSITYDVAGSSKDNYVIVITNANAAFVTIEKADPTVTAPVINGVVYGPAKTLQAIDLAPYKTADGYWEFVDATVIPTVSTKTYAARFVSNNSNYKTLENVMITVNVVPMEVVLVAEDKSVTYGANAPKFTFKAKGISQEVLATIGGSCTPTCTYIPGSAVGSYKINLNVAYSDPNYTFVVSDESGWLTVAPATINATATAESKVYDASAKVVVNFAINSGVFANDVDFVELSAVTVDGYATTSNAGTSKVSYTMPTLVGSKASNYQLNMTPKSGELTVEILKADITGVEFPKSATIEYGFDLTYAVFDDPGDAKGGTFAYENASLIVPGLPATYKEYKVIFTPADSKNYNTQEEYVTLHVIKCTLDYVVGISGITEVGQTITAATSGLPSAANNYIQYQWYRIDKEANKVVPIPGATEKSYVVTEKDVGYYLAVVTYFDENDPFVYANGVTEDFEEYTGIVAQTSELARKVELTFWQRIMDWLYRILAILTGVQLNGGLGLG